ncbi:MAG: ABC transporter ATP-binding protein [Geodermatophilaceae bacterium]
MTAVLEADSITRRFGGNVAVDDVSLALEEGEILGLIGPNGAGKTTLFNCLAGALRPTSGKVRLRGRDVTRLPAHARARLGLGRTFQIVRPFRSMTVREQVQVGAGVDIYRSFVRSLSRRGRVDRVDAVLQELDLTDYADRHTDALPLGLQRRLEIARAEALEPTVLLLDEPGAGLSDAELRDLSQRVAVLRERGRSIVLIEHSMDFAMSTCDRIIVLVEGRVIADGRPDEIRRNELVVAAYLGDEL